MKLIKSKINLNAKNDSDLDYTTFVRYIEIRTSITVALLTNY